MTNLGHERELEVIRIALDGELDLKVHFQQALSTAKSQDTFYILNKAFWLKWLAFVGLPRKDSFNFERVTSTNSAVSASSIDSQRQRRPVSIQNEVFRTSSHSARLKPNLLYGKDYVVVPPRVWTAFINWYGRTPQFPRLVIVYPVAELALRSATQLAGLQRKDSQLNEQ